jgi:hypothetical protein
MAKDISNQVLNTTEKNLFITGTVVAGLSTLYAIMPRDPNFYNLLETARYVLPQEAVPPNQETAAIVAAAGAAIMIGTGLKVFYRLKGKELIENAVGYIRNLKDSIQACVDFTCAR